jgi:hypothetical protein
VGVEPEGLAVAGRIMGMIASILIIVGLVITMILVCLGALGSLAG